MSFLKHKKNDIPRRRLVETESILPASSSVFKRNRTLSGTTSKRLDSVNTKSGTESPRASIHHLSLQRRKISGILILVLLSMILIWTLISNFTAVPVVGVDDASISKPIDSARYEKVIQDYISINPMSRFTFLLNQASLTAYVSSKLPEVLGVEERGMSSIGNTDFVIIMRKPVAGWKINGKQYYVDSLGVPFEVNYYITPDVQIVDESGVSLQTGATAIASNRFLSFVGRVVSLSKTSGYTVTQAILPSGTTRELEVRLKENNFLIKLSIDRPAGEQVEDMVHAVQYFIAHGQSPQYVDVRVSGKAFYI